MGMPTITPPEVLNAVRNQVKQELELETMKSNILYQKQYQKFLSGTDSEPVTEGQVETKAKTTLAGGMDDLTAKVSSGMEKPMHFENSEESWKMLTIKRKRTQPRSIQLQHRGNINPKRHIA